ncbi:hypothetical protein EWM64_g3150 [Hericium alpestre]|uniref:Uncharacterized protein n=1 Tax=Hericium alpestre TaxID=135208 RepID=A0A4Z0A1C0_9AGAM|nr:hypothetical protein EWM64_g3150 [Hericium alpestre]
MADVDSKQANAWLHDDNRVLLATLATLTLATSSVLLWRGKRRAAIELPDTDPDPGTGRSSFVQSTLAALHLSGLASNVSRERDGESDQAPAAANTALQEGGNARPAKDPKNSRSKERRRRGKDPLKDLSSKKFKDILRAQTKRSTTASSEDSPSLSPMDNKPDLLGAAASLSSGSAGEEDRRHSSARTAVEDATTPKASPSSRQMDSADRPSRSHSQEDDSPAASTSRAPSITPNGPSSSRPTSLPSHRRPLTPPPGSVNGPTTSSSPSSEASQASSLLQSSRSSQTQDWSSSSSYADISIPSSNTVTANTSPTSTSRAARGKSSSGGSWDWDGQSTFYRDPPPRFAKFNNANNNTSRNPTSASASAASPLPLLNSPLPTPAPLSPSPSPGPSRPRRTPTPRVGRGQNETPPPSTPGIALSSHTQIASLKGALEAAKMREEKNRLEAERLAKEVEMAKWRWSKDAGNWRRREMEMNNYIQYLVHNLHMYASASAQAQQPPGSHQPPQPPSHPATPAPGSAPLPLSTPPFPPPLPFSPLSPSGTPFPFSPAGPSFPPYSYPPQHPMQHQTLATFFPGPTSSGSRSPDRGRRRQRKRAEGEEGEVAKDAGEEDDSDEEGFHLSNEVAGAILKRPDSLRVKTRRRGEGSILVGAGTDAEGSNSADAGTSREMEGSGDEVDAFVFPSISDLGNPYIYKEKETEGDLEAGTGDVKIEGADAVVSTDEDAAHAPLPEPHGQPAVLDAEGG